MEESNIIGLDTRKDGQGSVAERKARIKREGDFYRVGIVRSKAHVAQASRPESLFHSALDHASFAVRTRVDSLLRPTGINVATIMPYAVTAFGFLRSRRMVKPALGILAAVAGVAVYLQQRRVRQAR